ncbi:hypothetical protein GB937_010318 [Aspergillus fischeri]|nr:hypothetical protein GB937_010318 [Aspergillus fischeri]
MGLAESRIIMMKLNTACYEADSQGRGEVKDLLSDVYDSVKRCLETNTFGIEERDTESGEKKVAKGSITVHVANGFERATGFHSRMES